MTIPCQCHKEASLNNSSGEIKSAQRQSKWRKLKWRVSENMQGKDVQAASETNVFTGTWLPLLRSPFSAGHSMGIKKNTYWGARTLVGPNLVHTRRQKSMFKMTLPWTGVSLIWRGPIAYLVCWTVSTNFHKPMSVPYMFNIAGFLWWLIYTRYRFGIIYACDRSRNHAAVKQKQTNSRKKRSQRSYSIPVVPHKAVAEVAKIRSL